MIRRRRPRFYKGEISDVLRLALQGKFSDGDSVKEFERKFAGYLGVRFAVSTSSGRGAMKMLLESLGLEKGDEILMSAYTLKDLVSLIQDMGLVVKLTDIEPDSFNIDPKKIEKQITSRTRVIIATHLFGLPCDIDCIMGIAKRHGIKVIEDCAHALGATYKSRRVGSLSDAAFFSFETIKPINTFGGGMVTTNDKALAQRAERTASAYPARSLDVARKIIFTCIEHLIIISPMYPLIAKMLANDRMGKAIIGIYQASHKSTNVRDSRLTNVQAFLGIRQLCELDKRNADRSVSAMSIIKSLDKGVSVQASSLSEGRIFYFFVIKAAASENAVEDIRRSLVSRGIDAGIRSEITDNCSKCLGLEGEYPVTDAVYDKAIQLPIYDYMSKSDMDRVEAA